MTQTPASGPLPLVTTPEMKPGVLGCGDVDPDTSIANNATNAATTAPMPNRPVLLRI